MRPPTRFERDTVVERTDADLFTASVDPGWWIINGPNGGYLAAILLRALTARVGDADRHVRSLTVHYLRPPREGRVEIRTNVVRAGRTVTTISGELSQDGRAMVHGLATFARSRQAMTFSDRDAPRFAPPSECPRLIDRMGTGVALQQRMDARWAEGEPYSAERGAARCGGWYRLAEPTLADAPLVAAMTDSFPPAVFCRGGLRESVGPVPTVDLTIHFRRELPLPRATPDDFYAVRFWTNTAQDGFIEEESEVWSARGELVAQSRQLALIV